MGVYTIGIIGTRGIPNRYGGFERFVELLVSDPCWGRAGYKFVIYGEKGQSSPNGWTEIRELRAKKGRRPLLYYLESIRRSTRECDLVLSCGVGVSVFSIFAIIRKRVLIVNPDGCEWRRAKWSWLGRLIIRAMYFPALFVAERVVLDSQALREDFSGFVRRKSVYIPYQAPSPEDAASVPVVPDFEIPTRFLLVIARLEPENNIEMIVRAFCEARVSGLSLLIIGDTSTAYYRNVLSQFEHYAVRYLGAIFDGRVLNMLRQRCLGYIHGHSVGGTNPSLLEACVSISGMLACHSNKYNREVAGATAVYFSQADELAKMIRNRFCGVIGSVPNRALYWDGARYAAEGVTAEYLRLFDYYRVASKHL